MSKHFRSEAARRLFLLCWLVYFTSYLGRLNYSAAMSAMIGTVLTKSQAGWIGTAFYVAYALGQFLNGMLADRVSARKMIVAGLWGMAALNVCFPLTERYELLLALRLGTGFCASMLWPALLKIMICRMERQDTALSSVHITSSIVAGNLVAYLSNAYLLSRFGWRGTFFAPALALAAVAVVWTRCSRPYDTPRTVEPSTDQESKPTDGQAGAACLPLSRLWLMPAFLAAIVPVVVHGVIKDGVTTWVPTYLKEVFCVNDAFSVMLTTVLPMVNLSGAYIAAWLQRKCAGSEMRASALLFASAAAALGVMLAFGDRSVWLTLLLFAVVTTAMFAINTLLINLFPLRFAREGRVGTVSGALNALAYAGTAAATGLIGALSDTLGWSSAVCSWLVAVLVAAVVCLRGNGGRRDVGDEGDVGRRLF